MQGELFRKKPLESVSSPEQLKDYLQVASPGIWAVLLAVVLLLGGLFAWSAVGTLETTVDAKVVVKDQKARIRPEEEAKNIKVGTTFYIDSQKETIGGTRTDGYDETVFTADVSLPDGVYNAQIVTEEVHPIAFLLESSGS